MHKVAKVLKKRKTDLSINKFAEYFPDEQACQDYLFGLKWPKGFCCPKCGNQTAFFTKRGQYQCKYCKHQTTNTAGTIFHKSHISLKLWFWAIYLFSRDKRGCSAIAIKNALNVSYPTAWLMLQKIRTAMMIRENQYILSGLVLADEIFIGGKTPGTAGRGTKKSRVLISMSITPTGIPLFVKANYIENSKSKTMDEALQQAIESNSIMVSDADPSLKSLGRYEHIIVNETKDPETAFRALKWLHKFVSNVKSSLLATYHGLSKKHLPRYMAEYCYRYNRRFCEPLIFEKLVKVCASVAPVTYADLTL